MRKWEGGGYADEGVGEGEEGNGDINKWEGGGFIEEGVHCVMWGGQKVGRLALVMVLFDSIHSAVQCSTVQCNAVSVVPRTFL